MSKIKIKLLKGLVEIKAKNPNKKCMLIFYTTIFLIVILSIIKLL